MTVPFVDTNVIIRLVSADDPGKQVAAARFFQSVRDGQLTIAAPVTVLAALQLYKAASLTFDDAMIVAAMRERGATELYSYDTGFDRVPGITRRQP